MTPTLLGRWETRFLLFVTAGVLVTVIYGLFFGFMPVFVILGYVLVFGFVWDALYQLILSFRWDQDWPTTFQVLAGIWEGAVVWLLFKLVGLPGIPAQLPIGKFIAHYSTVWFVVFFIAQGPIRLFFLRWRYRGGQWV